MSTTTNAAMQAVPDVEVPPDATPPAVVETTERPARAAVDQEPAFTLVHVDPATLTLEPNVRLACELDKPFVASIRDHGVLVPVVARRTGDGVLRVLMGQRRTLAAVQAGRPTVPVYVVEVPDEEKAAKIARTVVQVVENVHRAGLSEVDQVAAAHQLSLLGLSAGQIARRTHLRSSTVKVSLRVAASQVASSAMARHDLTLEQAAVVAEFAEDSDAVTQLTEAAGRSAGEFAHAAQWLRDHRAEETARQKLTGELTQAGVLVISREAYLDSRVKDLVELRPTTDSTPGTELTVQAHASCPGHAAFLTARDAYGQGDPVAPVFVCTDPGTHGHAARYAVAGAPLRTGRMSEEQKTERRRVIAHNRAWDSATVVRREWLREFCARRTPPKDAARWIALTLAAGTHEIRAAMESRHMLAAQLLDRAGTTGTDRRPTTGRQSLVDKATTASPARATMLTLAVLLAGFEQATSRNTWRSPTPGARTYFTTLRDWGYTLSRVERLVLDPDESAGPDQTTGGDTDGDTDPNGDDVTRSA